MARTMSIMMLTILLAVSSEERYNNYQSCFEMARQKFSHHDASCNSCDYKPVRRRFRRAPLLI